MTLHTYSICELKAVCEMDTDSQHHGTLSLHRQHPAPTALAVSDDLVTVCSVKNKQYFQHSERPSNDLCKNNRAKLTILADWPIITANKH